MRYFAIPKYFHQLLSPKRLAIFEACLIGLVSGLAAVLLKQAIGWLGGARIQASHLLHPWLALPAIGLIGGLLAGIIVERFAPETSGSGIPQVKAVLAKVPMSLDLRVAFFKLLGGTLALGSGLALGREGPTVQMGAALAAQLSHWFPTSPDHRRQLIAAGAGAGLAAAFNAPIAGVLFVVEELLQDLSGITLGTAILASFIGAVVSHVLGGQSLDINLNLVTHTTNFSVQEIPFYLVLGVLAGLLGSLFNESILASLAFYRRVLHLSLPLRIGLAGFVCALIVLILPDIFRDNTGLREILITGKADWHVAAIAFLAYFFLTIVAYGSGAPGGLFAPTLILGSALGYLIGLCEHNLLGISPATTYALAGMGTFFSAVARVPVTAIVIVFEMTTDFNLVLPLMIGSVTSYLVSEKVSPGSIYDRLLEFKGIYLEKELQKEGFFTSMKALDVMQRRVEILTSSMTLEEAIQAFSRSHHRGFPVVENGKLVGIITQTDLALYTERQLDRNIPLGRIVTTKPVTVTPEASLADVLYLLNRYQLSRLPVIEDKKVVGIITRSDLIRAEANHLSGSTPTLIPPSEPSYIVYQTRSTTGGKGRLLIPLANPQTAFALLQIAATIARDRDYELVCLQVVIVPRHNSPSETPVRTTKSRRLLRQAENLGIRENISVHTQVRVAHDVDRAILETIKDQHIDFMIMGWNAEPPAQGRIFGTVVDTIIRQAACEVMLVKLGERSTSNGINSSFCLLPSAFHKWLVPIAGGPNAQEAMQLLPALVSLGNSPSIELCQVFHPKLVSPDLSILEKSADFLRSKLQKNVTTIPIVSSSVAESVINLAETNKFDVVLVGASREGLLQHVINGNIPEAIARGVNSKVILVRSAIS
ncbi:chloride channel protein [Kamptonema sp. UHCC 0994]|uniref:chloride channel protein n=1 Tax=Kamptonema sp. UHCC 0994 TaxID=3031329 RepID=UPI0023BA83CF|nr:chloride channel protein [Kamptonema sp. UHCC 0994]MDF0556146.1 chloride channel protein [Kamptonema sp. UHCC 0994]